MANLLGLTVKDRITGFKGIVTGQVAYITGCNQCLVTPPVKKDGSRAEAERFDEQRLVVGKEKAITMDNSQANGFDKMAPKR
jgi:hypothetical protein